MARVSRKVVQLTHSPATERAGVGSPDGRSIAYTVEDDTHTLRRSRSRAPRRVGRPGLVGRAETDVTAVGIDLSLRTAYPE